MKKQINNIQILRILAALAVFMFHCYHDMECDFGFLNPLLEWAWFYMTFFFVLSGFVIYYSYSDKDMTDFENIKSFIRKRIIKLFPLYILYMTVSYFTSRTNDFLNIITFPLQITMLFSGTYYGYLANSGTWFISCIFICYLLCPLFISIIKKINNKSLFAILLLIVSISSCYPLIQQSWPFVNSYHTAYVRIFDFLIGMILSKLLFEKKLNFKNGYLSVLTIITVVLAVFAIRDMEILVDVCSPTICCLLLVTFSLNESRLLSKIDNWPPVKFVAKYSFEIYCGTAYTTMLIPIIYRYINIPALNIPFCFATNALVILLLVYYQKAVKILIDKISLKKYFILMACIDMILIMLKSFI